MTIFDDWLIFVGTVDYDFTDETTCWHNSTMSPPPFNATRDNNNPPLWSFGFNATHAFEDCVVSKSRYYINSSILLNGVTQSIPAPPLLVFLQSSYSSTDSDGDWEETYKYFYENITLDTNYILEHGTCQPTAFYIWGFSSLMLFTYCVFTCTVGLLLVTLQWDAWWRSQTDRYNPSISPYRDALDLTEEMRAHYDGEDLHSIPAKQLDELVENRDFRVRLDATDLPTARGRFLKHNVRAVGQQARRLTIRCWYEVVRFLRRHWTLKAGTEDAYVMISTPPRHKSESDVQVMSSGSVRGKSAIDDI